MEILIRPNLQAWENAGDSLKNVSGNVTVKKISIVMGNVTKSVTELKTVSDYVDEFSAVHGILKVHRQNRIYLPLFWVPFLDARMKWLKNALASSWFLISVSFVFCKTLVRT